MNNSSFKTVKGEEINYQFKLLYAIGIILVIIGHCTTDAGLGLFTDWFHVYSFHLGLFVFCSGYFYKNMSHQNILVYIRKKFRTLIVPIYAWNFVYAVIVNILVHFGFTIGGGGYSLLKLFIYPIRTGDQYVYNLGGWFVIPLFMIEIFNVVVRKFLDLLVDSDLYENKREIFICTFYLLLGICGNYLARKGLNTGWWLVLVRMLHFLPFYGIGTFYRRVLEKYDTVSSTVYFTVIFALQLVIILVYGKLPAYSQQWCNSFTEGSILPILEGCLGVALWLRIAKVLEPVLGNNKLVLLISNNAFAIMIHQFLGFMLMKTLFAILNLCGYCSDFNWEAYKTDIWYYYFPKGMYQTGILYIVAGLFFPIAVQMFCLKVKSGIKRLRDYNKLGRNS